MGNKDLNISLRTASEADLPFAWLLYREAMKPLTEELLTWNEAAQRQTIADEIAGGDASVILQAGQPVGWLLVHDGDDAVDLGQIYIVPTMRNRGIGTCILRQLIDDARHKDKALTLSVMKNNRAMALYGRLGFVQSGESAIKRHMIWRNGRV